MTLVTRTITNAGQPLCAPDGTVLAGVEITFTLITPAGLCTDAWDALSNERVTGTKKVTTDIAGEFSVELWPNDRGGEVTQYLCHGQAACLRDFIASLPSGATPLTWLQFMGGALPLPPEVLDALALHVLSPTAHPNATQTTNGFMSSADKIKLDSMPAGSIGNLYGAIAGEALSGHRAIVLDASGEAFYADQTVPNHIGRMAGITIGAAALGAGVTIMNNGLLTEPSWSWTPFAPIFLGTAGGLTQVPPTTGFLQMIGGALSATSMYVNLRQPLVII